MAVKISEKVLEAAKYAGSVLGIDFRLILAQWYHENPTNISDPMAVANRNKKNGIWVQGWQVNNLAGYGHSNGEGKQAIYRNYWDSYEEWVEHGSLPNDRYSTEGNGVLEFAKDWLRSFTGNGYYAESIKGVSTVEEYVYALRTEGGAKANYFTGGKDAINNYIKGMKNALSVLFGITDLQGSKSVIHEEYTINPNQQIQETIPQQKPSYISLNDAENKQNDFNTQSQNNSDILGNIWRMIKLPFVYIGIGFIIYGVIKVIKNGGGT